MMRSLPTLAFLIAAAVGCSTSSSSTAQPETNNQPEPTMTTNGDNDTTATTCSTEADVRAAVGTVCTITGTYQLKEFHSKKGEVFRTWPVVVMSDGTVVALESLWDESKMPGDADLDRYRDQQVEVTGMLYGQPPADNRKANMSQLTISPVDSLRLAP
jgi:hypothetical protein